MRLNGVWPAPWLAAILCLCLVALAAGGEQTQAPGSAGLLRQSAAASPRSPASPASALKLARTLVASEDFAGAIAACREITGQFPDCDQARYYLGYCLYRTGKFGEAIDELGRASRVDTPDKQALLARCWFKLAGACARAGNYGEAISAYKSILGQFPEREEAHYQLGWCLYKAGRVAEAIDELNKAARVESCEREALLMLASAYDKAGDQEKLTEMVTRFVEKFPDDSRAEGLRSLANYRRKDNESLRSEPEYKKAQGSYSGAEREHRWSANAMPLKVFIEESAQAVTWGLAAVYSDVTEEPPPQLIERALDEWSRASDGKVRFIRVYNQSDSDVCFVWTRESARLRMGCSAGETMYGAQRRTVNVPMVSGGTGRAVTAGQFYEVCLHELGHVLGLQHSPTPEDIMYPSTHSPPLSRLSDHDRERINALYADTKSGV